MSEFLFCDVVARRRSGRVIGLPTSPSDERLVPTEIIEVGRRCFRFEGGKVDLLKGLSELATIYELLGIT